MSARLRTICRPDSASSRTPSAIEPAAGDAECAALRAIINELNVGIVLLDEDDRVVFVNRAFRVFWRISDSVAESRMPFVKLMYQGRGMTASTVSHYLLSKYLARQMKLIQTGEEQPLHIRLANGAVIQFRCKMLTNGGRLLTYGNVSELAHHADALERLASIDGMTGLNNRRHFLVLAEIEWARFKRYGRPLGVLMIDVDRFKAVNDTFGHAAGDLVIKAVAEVLQKHKRSSDISGRFGGEEFVLLLPEANPDSALAAGERFRKLVAAHHIDAGGQQISITVSIGTSVARADVAGLEQMLKEADIALYEAKRSGRNRVCAFDPDRTSGLVAVNG